MCGMRYSPITDRQWMRMDRIEAREQFFRANIACVRPQARAGVEIPRPAGKSPAPLFALMRGRELKCPYAAMRVFVAWNGTSSRGNIAATCHDAILRQEDAGNL